jgi:hypothetical protein
MNWRLMGGILGGLFLAAPLVLILASTMLQLPHAPAAGVGRLSPVLTEEARRQLMTYRRDCVHRADCEAPLGCLPNIRARRNYCSDSECETDAQCPERLSCVPLWTVDDGPVVRYCIPAGVRKEGESCIEIPSSQEFACEPGLRCADGWCGRSCQLDNPASCPEGFSCANFSPGPACRPTCEGRTCPPGQQCMHDRSGASVCAVVYGPDCQREPCPAGRSCDAIFPSRRPGVVWMHCDPECSEDLPACPQGRLCDQGLCLKPCEPLGPNVCDPGYLCQRYVDSQPWACRFDM